MNVIKSKFNNFIFFASIIASFTIFNTGNASAAGTSLAPIGYIDNPANGATISGTSNVGGWFLDGNGVNKIEVLVDGSSMGEAQYGKDRSDVAKAFPDYQNANSGFQYALDTSKLTNGQHSLTVKETGNTGITTVLSTEKVNVQNIVKSLPAQGYIDSPTANSTISGASTIRGWFLDASGVSKIEILVDGNSVGLAQYGSERADVGNAFPDYQNANSGYQFSLDTRTLSNGQHSLTVKETGNNGVTTVLSSHMVNVQNISAIGYIESPTNGSIISGVSNVHGWFLDNNGVAKIEVLMDGNIVGSAQYGSERTDVAKAFPDYHNANSGYQFSLDTKSLSNGQHSLTIRETANNGVITVLNSQTVNVQNLQPIGVLDSPTNGSVIKGDTTIQGWALDLNGVNKVEVFVDGISKGLAQYGSARLDVLKVYPGYQNANAGYQLTFDTKQLTNGTHNLMVKETGNNGATSVIANQSVNVQNLPVISSFDTPAMGSSINRQVSVQGWALDVSGVSKIEVLVDGNVQGTAQYGGTRLDVAKAYPAYENSTSGYQFTLNVKQFPNGVHTLTVRETGNNGTTTVIGNENVNVQNLPALGSIDSPGYLNTIKGTATVQGWFLDGSDVAKIEVLIDGQSYGQAQYGNSRSDVGASFPNYQNANSGYQFSFDTLQIPDGQHALAVRETGTNGTTTTITSTILISNGDPYALIDLRKPTNITANDLINFFKRYYPSSPLVNDVNYFISAQNVYGVNAQYLAAHAVWETGWGTSNIYIYKHNLFGYGAYDTDPFNGAYYFPTDGDSINFEAYIVRKNYLDPTGRYYNGSNLKGMNVRYATDQNWANGIAGIMEKVKPFNYTSDYAYYYQTSILPASSTAAPTFGTTIPTGQPTP